LSDDGSQEGEKANLGWNMPRNRMGVGIGMGMEWVVHSLKGAPGAIQALKLLKLIV